MSADAQMMQLMCLDRFEKSWLLQSYSLIAHGNTLEYGNVC
jgi:hypothetical protein